ncbi:MAG: exodeoxyribonuclease VII small subunit [Moraxellaceae bacterium]|nr:exodeoxyribonuclease VII small subunit [Moraxellaceae bacterium]
MTSSNSTNPSFKEAFATLKANAQKLEDQTEPDIEHLLEVVEQSTAAYKICKARIDAVEKRCCIRLSLLLIVSLRWGSYHVRVKSAILDVI